MAGGESEVIHKLVAAGAAGDPQAQSELLGRYWPLIRQVVRAQRRRLGGKQRDDTEDLQQQVAMELLESLPKQQWRGSQAFAAWVRRLAQCEVLDAQRFDGRQRRNLRNEVGLDEVQVAASRRGPESVVDDSRRAAELARGIGALKEEYAAALVLHYKGFSHGEIGELLGCTAEAARKLVARARAKLTATGGP